MYKYTCINRYLIFDRSVYNVNVITKEAPPFRFRICELCVGSTLHAHCTFVSYTRCTQRFFRSSWWKLRIDSSVCMMYTGTGANLLHFKWWFLGIVSSVPEFMDPVFAKTSPNARFVWLKTSVSGLFSRKIGSINSALISLHWETVSSARCFLVLYIICGLFKFSMSLHKQYVWNLFFPLFSSLEVKFKALCIQLSFFEATVVNAAVNYYFSRKKEQNNICKIWTVFWQKLFGYFTIWSFWSVSRWYSEIVKTKWNIGFYIKVSLFLFS